MHCIYFMWIIFIARHMGFIVNLKWIFFYSKCDSYSSLTGYTSLSCVLILNSFESFCSLIFLYLFMNMIHLHVLWTCAWCAGLSVCVFKYRVLASWGCGATYLKPSVCNSFQWIQIEILWIVSALWMSLLTLSSLSSLPFSLSLSLFPAKRSLVLASPFFFSVCIWFTCVWMINEWLSLQIYTNVCKTPRSLLLLPPFAFHLAST